ncbi:MAG: adenylate/guanylate cyclase domain-containing protein [Hyphomicrobiaceae bacterium]|nr:adenylate/guanylate cyclase domain-containing protein [Hyphomicrobiaceae bacterium]
MNRSLLSLLARRAAAPARDGPDPRALPARVTKLIREHEERSERLIGWAQLAVVVILSALYFIAPRPADAPARALIEPVPVVLAAYFAFTALRLAIAYRGRLPGWLLCLSILADTALLLGLIWSFHGAYGQPAAFSLKVPTFVYIFAFVAMRALRFDYRYVLTAGIAAAGGWALLVALAVAYSGEDAVTRNFVTYLTSNRILVGAEFDKIVTVLMVTALLALALRRAQDTLIVAIREQSAGREIRRFLSSGVAEVITSSEQVIEAGEAAEREAAILMLDIRGFTRFSTTVEPKAVVDMLTRLHARILPHIREHRGVVDKFLGDGVMATFGAVEPSRTAAADALRALEAIMAEVDGWRGSADSPLGDRALEVNGAVAAGKVVFATLGTGDRLEYTVIGEAVNLAAKLEKHNKAEGTRALVPAAAYELARSQGYRPARAHERHEAVLIPDIAERLDLVALAARTPGSAAR